MIKKIIYASICCILSIPSISYAMQEKDDKGSTPKPQPKNQGQQGNKGGGPKSWAN